MGIHLCCSRLIINPAHPCILLCPNKRSHDFRTFPYQSSRSFSLGFRLLAPNIQIGLRQFFWPIGVTSALATRLSLSFLDCEQAWLEMMVNQLILFMGYRWRTKVHFMNLNHPTASHSFGLHIVEVTLLSICFSFIQPTRIFQIPSISFSRSSDRHERRSRVTPHRDTCSPRLSLSLSLFLSPFFPLPCFCCKVSYICVPQVNG